MRILFPISWYSSCSLFESFQLDTVDSFILDVDLLFLGWVEAGCKGFIGFPLLVEWSWTANRGCCWRRSRSSQSKHYSKSRRWCIGWQFNCCDCCSCKHPLLFRSVCAEASDLHLFVGFFALAAVKPTACITSGSVIFGTIAQNSKHLDHSKPFRIHGNTTVMTCPRLKVTKIFNIGLCFFGRINAYIWHINLMLIELPIQRIQ